MPVTGGKAYMMIFEDIKDLASTADYRWVKVVAEVSRLLYLITSLLCHLAKVQQNPFGLPAIFLF